MINDKKSKRKPGCIKGSLIAIGFVPGVGIGIALGSTGIVLGNILFIGLVIAVVEIGEIIMNLSDRDSDLKS